MIESASELQPPKRYRNQYGQLLEHSPYCERDVKPPALPEPKDERGEFEVRILKHGQLQSLLYSYHPFDVVGWDGYMYPYAISIHDFEPITGRIHQPPPVHQMFEAHNFVVCSFVPRKFDYHPQSIPAPYNHSNIDSDEVLFYAEGDFMSRRGVERASLTLHPGGLPHGPHPGTVEASIGQGRNRRTRRHGGYVPSAKADANSTGGRRQRIHSFVERRVMLSTYEAGGWLLFVLWTKMLGASHWMPATGCQPLDASH